MAKHKSFPEVIYVKTYCGQDKITAMKEFEKANNLPYQDPENIIFIEIPSREELQNRIKEY